MKDILNLIGWALAIIFCTLFLLKCNHNIATKPGYRSAKDSTKKTIVDTTHRKPILVYKDSFIKGDTKYITKYQRGDTVYVPTKSMYLTTGDTIAIVNDYYLKKIFKGSFSTDSVNVTWFDSVSHNMSLGHKFVVQNLRHTILPTTVKRILYVGGSTGYCVNTKEPILAPTFGYSDKQNRLWTGSYDIINQSFQFGVLIKVHL